MHLIRAQLLFKKKRSISLLIFTIMNGVGRRWRGGKEVVKNPPVCNDPPDHHQSRRRSRCQHFYNHRWSDCSAPGNTLAGDDLASSVHAAWRGRVRQWGTGGLDVENSGCHEFAWHTGEYCATPTCRHVVGPLGWVFAAIGRRRPSRLTDLQMECWLFVWSTRIHISFHRVKTILPGVHTQKTDERSQ